MFGIGKKVKTYGSVMTAFSTIVTDLKEVVSREEANVNFLAAQREEIDERINDSELEIGNCSLAIDNVKNMFPNM